MTLAEYARGKAKGYKVVDVCPNPQIAGAVYVDLSTVNGAIEGLAKDEKIPACLSERQTKLFSSKPIKGIRLY